MINRKIDYNQKYPRTGRLGSSHSFYFQGFHIPSYTEEMVSPVNKVYFKF